MEIELKQANADLILFDDGIKITLAEINELPIIQRHKMA